jgi:polar amino acid transport system substrate-binding protein
MRTFTSLFAAALAAIMFATIQPAAAEVLRVGTEYTYYPFNYRDADGTLKGYDVDVALEVGKRLGADVEFVCQKWDGMIPALLANKFDLVVASMSITEERLQKIDFSAPYRISIGQFIAKKGSGLKLFNADGSVNPDGFKGVKVGLQRATTYDNWIQAKAPKAAIVRYDNVEPLYLDLQAGRVDTIMTNPMKAYLSFLSKPDGAGFEVIGPQIADTEYFGIGVGIGLRKGNEPLVKRIDVALKAMIEDGTLNEFSLRYFPFPIHPQEWKGTGQ